MRDRVAGLKQRAEVERHITAMCERPRSVTLLTLQSLSLLPPPCQLHVPGRLIERAADLKIRRASFRYP